MRPVSEEKNYEIAIFDFDGTLLDTSRIYPFIHKELLRILGIPEEDIAYITNEYWNREVASKNGHIDMHAYLSSKHNIDISPVDFRIRRNEIERQYFTGEHTIKELLPLNEYLIEPTIHDLKRLSENGARCFIVSHNYGNVIDWAMKALGLSDLFEDYYTQCAWEALRHPDYDKNEPKKKTFAHLAAQASYPSICVVYDDMLEHIDSATSLGMDAVWIDSAHACPPFRR